MDSNNPKPILKRLKQTPIDFEDPWGVQKMIEEIINKAFEDTEKEFNRQMLSGNGYER